MSIRKRLNNLENNIQDINTSQEQDIIYKVTDTEVKDNKLINYTVEREENGKVIYLDMVEFEKELDKRNKGINEVGNIFSRLTKEQLEQLIL